MNLRIPQVFPRLKVQSAGGSGRIQILERVRIWGRLSQFSLVWLVYQSPKPRLGPTRWQTLIRKWKLSCDERAVQQAHEPSNDNVWALTFLLRSLTSQSAGWGLRWKRPLQQTEQLCHACSSLQCRRHETHEERCEEWQPWGSPKWTRVGRRCSGGDGAAKSQNAGPLTLGCRDDARTSGGSGRT